MRSQVEILAEAKALGDFFSSAQASGGRFIWYLCSSGARKVSRALPSQKKLLCVIIL